MILLHQILSASDCRMRPSRLARDNFGRATDVLSEALAGEIDGPGGLRSETLYRLLRLVAQRGYGERLLKWFVDTGHANRYAPIYAAFIGLVRGANTLLDVNPEVRTPAEHILASLAGTRPATEPERPVRPRRGRSRHRRDE